MPGFHPRQQAPPREVEISEKKDGKLGVVGYQINFSRYFYRYAPPRPRAEIEAGIPVLEPADAGADGVERVSRG